MYTVDGGEISQTLLDDMDAEVEDILSGSDDDDDESQEAPETANDDESQEAATEIVANGDLDLSSEEEADHEDDENAEPKLDEADERNSNSSQNSSSSSTVRWGSLIAWDWRENVRNWHLELKEQISIFDDFSFIEPGYHTTRFLTHCIGSEFDDFAAQLDDI